MLRLTPPLGIHPPGSTHSTPSIPTDAFDRKNHPLDWPCWGLENIRRARAANENRSCGPGYHTPAFPPNAVGTFTELGRSKAFHKASHTRKQALRTHSNSNHLEGTKDLVCGASSRGATSACLDSMVDFCIRGAGIRLRTRLAHHAGWARRDLCDENPTR
jgi:hypothetical protein